MRRRNSRRDKLVLLAAFFFFVALGTFTWPGGVFSYSGRNSGSGLFLLLKVAAGLYVICSVLPPGLVLGAAASSALANSPAYRRCSLLALWVCGGIALLGIPATFAYAAPVAPLEFAYVNIARMAMLFCQVLFCRHMLRRVVGAVAPVVGWRMGLYALPMLLLSTWSLASGIAAAGQAVTLAEGGAYCIGDTSRRPYSEIESVFDLRGVDLVVAATGYKHNSYWFFHAILVTPENTESSYWNWSMRQMTFTPVTPRQRRLLIQRIDDACAPKVNFISWLLWPL